MGIINQLPASVINQIAAGEVVERPASVVKELLENAIDAGAKRVDLTVERGGKDLIRVADNGKGMSAEDLPLAFLPHATSKLTTADDLFRISTLGFRGEALAAIAEISRVRCQTRQTDAADGPELTIDGGISGEIAPAGGSVGTVIEVRNLFFNTPVRRSFLKSDATEAGHVQEVFQRVALAHPTVHFTFRSSGKLAYDLPPVTGLRDRVEVFLGRELAESLLWVESRIESTHIWGYVAHPSQSRSSTKAQFLFVGGRFVRDRSLGHALSEAYRGLLMVGRMPVAFLHLDVPFDEVDVNVHPTKVEVRFRDSHKVYSQLLSTVRQTFLTSDLHSKLQAAETFGGPEASRNAPRESLAEAGYKLTTTDDRRQEVAGWFTPSQASPSASPSSSVPAAGNAVSLPFRNFPSPGYAGGKPTEDWNSRLGPAANIGQSHLFDEFATPTIPAANEPPPREFAPDPAREPAEETGERPVDPAPLRSPGFLKAIQVHDSYLIAETDEGMMVIDQHALHERILYEELRRRLEKGGVESQRLLVPEPVHLSAAEAVAVIEQSETLRRLGVEVEPFGGDTVLVGSIPAMLTGISPERMVRDLAEHLRTRPTSPTPDELLADLLHMIACKAAVKAGQKLEPEEIEALVERRHLVADSHHCPHGRPTALVFTKSELERQFGRI